MSMIPDNVMTAVQEVIDGMMVDSCKVEREVAGAGTSNFANFTVNYGLTEIYNGKCYLGDRVEGSLTTGGFGANAQESAYDGRTHNMLLRLPYSSTTATAVLVGDLVTMTGGRSRADTYRITAYEASTHQSAHTFRLVRFDPDASRS